MRQLYFVAMLLIMANCFIIEAQNTSTITMEPLSMRDCLLRAIRYNLSLEIEGYNPKIREFDLQFAHSQFDPTFNANFLVRESETEQVIQQFDGSYLFPSPMSRTMSWDAGIAKRHSLGGTISATYGITYYDGMDYPRSIRNPAWGHSLNFTLTQPLLRNLGIAVNTASIRMAENEQDRSYYSYENQVSNTLANVQSAYWNLANAIDNYELQRKSLEQTENLYKITLARIKAGSLAAADILDAERNVASKQDALIIAERNIYEAEDALKQLIRPLDIQYYKNIRILPTERVNFQPVNPEDLDFEKNLQAAMQNRADLKANEISLKNIGITIDRNKNQLLPSLDFSARIGLEGAGSDFGDAAEAVVDRNQFSWQVGLSLEVPIGNRAAKSTYEQSLLQQKQLIAQHKSLEDLVMIEVRSAIRQLGTSIHRVTTAHRSRELAEKQLANEENKFRAGIITLYQVQDTEQKLTEARINESNALFEYQQAFIKLDKAKGLLIKNLSKLQISLPLPQKPEKHY